MKTTSWITSLGLALALGWLSLSQTGCQRTDAKHPEHALAYSCPMHPEVVQAGAGTCPKCGMKLDPKPGNH